MMDIVNDYCEPEVGKSSFSLYYRKLNNSDLFTSLENSELEITNSKNYIPIYETYFNLNETNYNSINLNHRFYVSGLSGIIDKNNIQAAVVDTFKSTPESLTCVHKPIFIKFSPLIDPVKYMSGKYDTTNKNTDILKIPTLSKFDQQGLPKANDKNNAAYVDSFFSYLSSQVLHHHDFIHGLDFYGSFNANKNNFYYNVIDDLEYLNGSSFFNKNKGILFDVEDIDEYSFDSESQNNNDTRNKKNKIKIDEKCNIDNSEYTIHDNFDTVNNELNMVFNTASITSVETNVSEINNNANNLLETLCEVNIVLNTDNSILSNNSNESNTTILNTIEGSIHLNKDNGNNSDDTESCSSRSSYTDNDEECNEDETNENDDKREKREKFGNKIKKSVSSSNSKSSIQSDIDDIDDDISGSDNEKNNKTSKNGSDNEENFDDDDEEFDDEDDDTLWATIKNFPVTAIMLEKCEDTLDSLMMQEDEMSEGEWKSALMQVIMTLITYQKMFGFTHNDLHTNNIMYIYTEKEYLYYHYNKKYYRVPTYNRIFKIIDFGRSIYRYKSKIICSDSFSSSGDAATQYNCEPYFNENKPRLEPNFSFDLCRLGCSIFDYFIDNINDVPKICKKEPLAKLIVDWVTDDQNRNILYKTNGEERYPDFKLYKMIARNVHNHTPHAQLSKPIFAAYEFPKKQVKSRHRIINIDKMQSYVD